MTIHLVPYATHRNKKPLTSEQLSTTVRRTDEIYIPLFLRGINLRSDIS